MPPKRNKRNNPTDAKELAKAKRLSSNFHGTAGEVIELSAKERRLPRYVVALGEMPEVKYEPPTDSKRGQYTYVHRAGDRGFGKKGSNAKPMLAVDPRSGKPIIVPMRSPVKFSSRRGLVG